MNPLTWTHCYAVPDASCIVDLQNPTTGRSHYANEDLEQIQARHPGAELMLFTDWTARRAAAQDTPITWDEVTAEVYDDMLNVLPPAGWQAGAFLVGEPTDHHAQTGAARFQCFRRVAGKHFASSRPLTRKEFKAIATLN